MIVCVALTVGEIPEQVEVRLVARVVYARDHLCDAVALASHLADDHVVLVVPGHGDDEVRRPRDPGPLEDEDLGRVADDRRVLELLLEPREAVAPLLDDVTSWLMRRSPRATFEPTLPPPATMMNIRGGCRCAGRLDHAGLDGLREHLDRVAVGDTVRRP